jgi:streptogramin lyase
VAVVALSELLTAAHLEAKSGSLSSLRLPAPGDAAAAAVVVVVVIGHRLLSDVARKLHDLVTMSDSLNNQTESV